MNHWKRFTLGLGLSAMAMLPSVSAQDSTNDPLFVYEAKVVCKNVASTNAADLSFDFGPHFIRTVVNLKNRLDEPARVRVQAIEATNIGSGSLGESGGMGIALRPNQAVFVACKDVRRLISKNDGAIRIDGYLRLTSTVPLTVDAVYNALTRRPDGRSEGTSVDVEHVNGRLIHGGHRGDRRPVAAF